ncbi:MAG TPA: hypothetical protein VG101_14130 [Puia sp.]|jgi:hypothetical protein|nr:hypothetical protein [Puia sp.]
MITPRKLSDILFSGNRDALLVAIAGFILIQLLSRHGGIGLSPDSIVYLSTAQNIHDHGMINDYTNQPMMDFPAGYPIFLSGLIFLTGHSVPWFGPVLDGLLFGLLIWLSGWMMDRFSQPSRWYKWPLLIFILLSPCLLEVYSMIWSETLFLLLSILFMIGCHRYFQDHSIRTLLGIAVIAGLSCLTRYAGISIIMMGGMLMLCDGRLRWGPKKIGHLVLFGAVAILIPALNVYRNWRVTDTFTGYREKAIRSLAVNLHDVGSVFCDWLPFFNGRYSWATAIALLFILGITGIFIYRLVRKTNFFSYDTIAASYFVAYAAFILGTASVSRFQQLDSRLLSPLFLPWLWGSTIWIPAVLSHPVRTRKIGAVTILTIAGGCFLYGECNAFQFNWEGIKYAGIPGYTEDTWQKSPTMAYVKAHKAELEAKGTIYSSCTDGLWFLANVPAELMPHVETREDIDYLMRHDHFIVIWFDDSVNTDLIDVNYIRKYKELIGELHFDDGAIYYFRTPKRP